MSGVIIINKNDSDYRESGIYAIKRLFEMGFTEDEIGAILNQALQISVQEILDEKKEHTPPENTR